MFRLTDKVPPIDAVLSRWGRYGFRMSVPLSNVSDGSSAAPHGHMYGSHVAYISTVELMATPKVVWHGLGAINDLNMRPAQTANEYAPCFSRSRPGLTKGHHELERTGTQKN